jgi:pyrroline-5-carboxylate reductase
MVGLSSQRTWGHSTLSLNGTLGHGTLGFLGYGNMGSAILEGLLGKHVLNHSHALVYDPEPSRQEVAQRIGVAVAETPEDLARRCDFLLLAVKPQTMESAIEQAKPGLKDNTLFISIAAGLNMAWFQKRLGAEIRIARVMPNTPALVQAGASGIALSPTCTAADQAVVRTVFESIGVAEIVPELAIDAVTALSGSGPAYFFYMVECLVKAAVAEGLEEPLARRLAAQTLYGAGALLKTSGEPAAELRAKVTSKGGTTEAAIKYFQAHGLEPLVHGAVHAAAARSRELGG